MTAIVFPGQGSQYLNMSMDFNDNFDVAKKVFQEIEDSTQINIRKIIAENPSDNLNQTKYTQISIFSASMAIYKSLLNEVGNEIIKPNFFLGHSLGEYSALAAGNFINIADASILIKKRGELMHSSIKPNISGMAAIIGKNADFIDDLIKKNNLKLVIANDNSPMQVVVSGLIEDIISSERLFSENGVKRYVKLNVSAAFHSNFMNDAQRKLINVIDMINFKNSNLPIISNYDSKINSNIESIIFALKNQMANRVRWTESIIKLEETDTTQIIEIGPGKVLSGLIARITKKFDIKSIDKIEDLKKFD
ncbi:MAG: ACP S-malonyltransferase [Proteobacteria bacterium]|jgi:[acyl-carrier-protein] S-malonyltransferase|nr:ACP S-malonyltransferase [Pseudomonadota bacterium]MDA1181733.1 ACP S-malonyltransferase [Pseudomonadota bacterium]